MTEHVTLVVASSLSHAITYCRSKGWKRVFEDVTQFRDGDRRIHARDVKSLYGIRADEIIIVEDCIVPPTLFTLLAHDGQIRVETRW